MKESSFTVSGNASRDELIKRTTLCVKGITPTLEGLVYVSKGLRSPPGKTERLLKTLIPDVFSMLRSITFFWSTAYHVVYMPGRLPFVTT